VAFPKRLLSADEQMVMDLRPHWIALAWPVAETALDVAATILVLIYLPGSWPTWTRWAVVTLAVAFFLFQPLPRIVRWATSHFVVTTDRVIHRSGWFAKQSMEIPLENISDVRFHQGVFERVIGAGDLTLESPGTFGQESFDDIRNPELVQKAIYEMNEANQRRMRAPGPATSSAADELAKLDRLRRDGVITEEEFQSKKAQVLGME
jgi:membrane protein YdbS with pleckstrin-like domain